MQAAVGHMPPGVLVVTAKPAAAPAPAAGLARVGIAGACRGLSADLLIAAGHAAACTRGLASGGVGRWLDFAVVGHLGFAAVEAAVQRVAAAEGAWRRILIRR